MPGKPKIQRNVQGRPGQRDYAPVIPKLKAHFESLLHKGVFPSKRQKTVNPVAASTAEMNHSRLISSAAVNRGSPDGQTCCASW